MYTVTFPTDYCDHFVSLNIAKPSIKGNLMLVKCLFIYQKKIRLKMKIVLIMKIVQNLLPMLG